MIPKSFSASSLHVAELCLARYHAEHIKYGKSIQSSAASTGIVCHGTFERFVKDIFIKKVHGWDENVFWAIFDEEYELEFGPDRTKPEYTDAHNLCYDWFHRDGQQAKLTAAKILSVESKNNFLVKTNSGEIPVNYIMDRLDRIGPGEYRVVDYKSNRVGLTPSQLRKKIQARLYALIVQIKYKDAERIWVEFDFLRHGTVATVFTREDNKVTWRMLQRAIKRIINTPDDKAPETLNSECGWCIRKSDCKALQSNIAAGGIFSKDENDLAKLYKKIADQKKAQENLLSEIESLLLESAIQQETLEFETDDATIKVTAAKRRKPNRELIASILGPELSAEVGSFRVSDIDLLIRQGRVSDGQATLLQAAMPMEVGEPSIKVELKEGS